MVMHGKCWSQDPSSRPSMHDIVTILRGSEVKVFGIIPISLNSSTQTQPSGEVKCAEPVVLKGGHERLFLGFENGLWLAPRHPSSQFSLHQVLDLRNVSQCTVLQDIGIVLVLAGKANILGANGATSPSVGACKIEELVNADNISSVTMVRLNDWNHVVTRFAAGVVDGRNLVIYLRKYTGKEYQVYHQHNGVYCIGG
ncbi:hypothetical protein DL96DRAFT_753685 [Flagelloscypha sp. PMI_526]|nr:hypothetical protein DL96DRAFT_753685 [Flagelloscypha sp. PMI_526]